VEGPPENTYCIELQSSDIGPYLALLEESGLPVRCHGVDPRHSGSKGLHMERRNLFHTSPQTQTIISQLLSDPELRERVREAEKAYAGIA
jgi:hypothetical protein